MRELNPAKPEWLVFFVLFPSQIIFFTFILHNNLLFYFISVYKSFQKIDFLTSSLEGETFSVYLYFYWDTLYISIFCTNWIV